MSKFKTFLAYLLSLMLVVSAFTLLLICNISEFFTTKQMEKNISNINITHEINKIQNSSATGENKAEVSDVINTAYNQAKQHGISKKLVNEMFNSIEIKKFLGKTIGSTTDYVVNNNQTKIITSDDFNEILDNNIDTWIENSNVKISDSKKEVLLIRMKSASKGIIDNLPTSKTVANKLGTNTIELIHFVFSNKLKIILLLTSLVSIGLIAVIKRKRLFEYLMVSFFLVASLTIATSFIIPDIVTYMFTEYSLAFLTSSLSDILAHRILITGIVVGVCSCAMGVIYFLLKRRFFTKKVI